MMPCDNRGRDWSECNKFRQLAEAAEDKEGSFSEASEGI